MMELTNDVRIVCNRCREVNIIPKDYLDFDSYVEERNMGASIEYYSENECRCGRCNNLFRFRISGWEYPEGAYDYQDYEISGGNFEEEPNMAIVYYREDFDLEAAFVEYDRVKTIIQQIARDKNMLYRISSREFEEVVERVFQDNGFITELTPATRDGGKDIIATKMVMGRPVIYYIECKKYGRNKKIGVSIVRELYGVQSSDRINKAMVVTTAHFSPDAVSYAQEQNHMIDLMDIDEIHELIMQSANNTRW